MRGVESLVRHPLHSSLSKMPKRLAGWLIRENDSKVVVQATLKVWGSE